MSITNSKSFEKGNWTLVELIDLTFKLPCLLLSWYGCLPGMRVSVRLALGLFPGPANTNASIGCVWLS